MVFQIFKAGIPRKIVRSHATYDIDEAFDLYKKCCEEYAEKWCIVELSVAIREVICKENSTCQK